MGANAQTTVPTFTAGAVLTAAQMNQSARTGVPVFAGTTERDAAFGGSGEKTLAEGQLCYLESTNVVQYYDGSSWATVGPAAASGLVLVKSQVVGSAVSTVTVTSAFSATYDNYIITYNDGTGTTEDALEMRFGATATNYYQAISGNTWSATASNSGGTTATSFTYAGNTSTNGNRMYVYVDSPFLARRTTAVGYRLVTGGAWTSYGMLNNTTSYTDFTFFPSSGTVTGGTVRVY